MTTEDFEFAAMLQGLNIPWKSVSGTFTGRQIMLEDSPTIQDYESIRKTLKAAGWITDSIHITYENGNYRSNVNIHKKT